MKEIKSWLETVWFNIKILKHGRPTESEKLQIDQNLKYAFEVLDELKVPFLIQNKVIMLAEHGKSFDNNINSILSQWQNERKEQKEYWYQYRFRGCSPGCQPKGFIKVDHSIGKFGAVAYDRELSEREINEYELLEI